MDLTGCDRQILGLDQSNGLGPSTFFFLRVPQKNPGNCRSYRGATDNQLILETNSWGVYCLVNPFTGTERLLPVPSIHGGLIDEEGYLREEMPVRKLVVCPHSGLVAAILGHEYSAKVALFAPESAAWSWTVSSCDPWRSILLEYVATTSEFLVFQADLQSPRWVKVDTIGGDEALFVGRLSSRAVRAGRHGLRGDQIFFLDDSAAIQRPRVCSGSTEDAFANVYDMKDGRVSEVLRMQPYRNGASLATWLFREDADAEE
ncbi:hypothetical protein ACQ4PT_062771 [Festuca glaucescens]